MDHGLGENLIFLISQPRSGSTLLQRMLAGHPEVYTTAEPWIMLHLVYGLRRTGLKAEYNARLARKALEDFCQTLSAGEQTYTQAIRGMALSLYQDALSGSGRQYFLDKTPRYYFIIPELLKIFPNARYIILLRNPLAVLASILETWVNSRGMQQLAKYKYDLLLAPRLLADGITLLDSRAALVRYENLVNNPSAEIEQVCARLQLPFHASMIEYGQQPCPPGRMGDTVGIHKHTRPTSDYVDKWISTLASGGHAGLAREYLRILGSDLLGDLGYSFEDLEQKLQSIPSDPDPAKETFRAGILTDLQAAADPYQRAENRHAADPVSQKQRGEYTVQFYVYKNVHWPMFEELVHYLQGQPEVAEIIICLPFLPQIMGVQDYGLIDKLLELNATIVTNPYHKPVDVTFIADAIGGKVQGCGAIVNLGHGTISKGYYFTDSVWTERENWVDLLCVPGPYALERLGGLLRTRAVATGMPKLDPVFAGAYNRARLCELLKLDPQKKIALYAPTFNKDLSSAYDFQGRFGELHHDHCYLLIKLHGSTPPDTRFQYRRLAERHPNFRFIEDHNLAPYIGGADILISDVSSAAMEFMALDRPVILYNNPNCSQYHGYDPEDIEYKWRNFATQVATFDELKAQLHRIMCSGDDKSELRRQYARMLFADLTGNACHKVWEETKNIISTAAKHHDLPTLSIVTVLAEDNRFAVRQIIHNIQFYSVMPIELVLVVTTRDQRDAELVRETRQFNQFIGLTVLEMDPQASMDEALLAGAQRASGKIILVMRDSAAVYRNFDYVLYRTFQQNPECTALTGITTLPDSQINYATYIPADKNSPADRIAYQFINRYHCTATGEAQLSCLPPLFAFKRDGLDLSRCTAYSQLQATILHPGRLKLCLSLFYTAVHPEDMAVLKQFWRARLRAALKQRIEIGRAILDAYYFPDLEENLVDDLRAAGEPAHKLMKIVWRSTSMRMYDLAYKKKLIKNFPHNAVLREALQKEIEVLRRLAPQDNGCLKAEPTAITCGRAEKPRALFYFFKNVHVPVLLPIYHKLKALHPEVQIAFGYMPHAPEIRAGFTAEELKHLRSYGAPLSPVPQDFRPDITFIADAVYPWIKDCGKLVHVGHGVLSKGQYYTDTQLARREQAADLICVPGAYHASMLQQIITRPVVATGMAKLDSLFAGRLTRQVATQKFGLPMNHYRYILFAPTFNDELSSIPWVQDRISQVIPDERTLLFIKLHGSTRREYCDLYRDLVQKDPRVIFADELDITPFLALADVMISDVSSAMMEFAALDKPVVLFNSPDWQAYQHFHPADIEFRWRDIGVQVRDLDEMKAAVAQSLACPAEHADKRRQYTDQLFANKYDGRAARRIIDQALALLREG